jgi:lysosomal acid lipase/cholesteryl ester hydrolase
MFTAFPQPGISEISKCIFVCSWHEMGVYDLPAEIDYILTYTTQKNLRYVGHSMGTTMFYVLMSKKPEYNAKISHMVALAPVAFLRNTKSPFASITRLLPSGVSTPKGMEHNY